MAMSASAKTTFVPRAVNRPLRTAAPLPSLRGRATTRATGNWVASPRAIASVSSVEPSSTITSSVAPRSSAPSRAAARRRSSPSARRVDSLYVGTTSEREGAWCAAPFPPSGAGGTDEAVREGRLQLDQRAGHVGGDRRLVPERAAPAVHHDVVDLVVAVEVEVEEQVPGLERVQAHVGERVPLRRGGPRDRDAGLGPRPLGQPRAVEPAGDPGRARRLA